MAKLSKNPDNLKTIKDLNGMKVLESVFTHIMKK